MADELKAGQKVRWNKFRDKRDDGWCYGTVSHRVPRPTHNANIYILIDPKGRKVQKVAEALQVVSEAESNG
jgi:hypothetical protein